MGIFKAIQSLLKAIFSVFSSKDEPRKYDSSKYASLEKLDLTNNNKLVKPETEKISITEYVDQYNNKPFNKQQTPKEVDVPIVYTGKPGRPKGTKNKTHKQVFSLDFVAFDFETANRDRKSACQLGIVVVKNGEITERKNWLINPCTTDFTFTYLHGITYEKVKNEPTFCRLWPEIEPYISNQKIIGHNARRFDVHVLRDLWNEHNIEHPCYDCIDTLDISRETWSNLPNHKLNTITEYLGISLNHHDAESDAYAAAQIIIKAVEHNEKLGKRLFKIKN